MNKLVVSFVLLFFLAVILDSIMEGGGGAMATRLTSSHTAAVTTLNISSTTGFLKSDYVQIGDELIRYTDKTDTTFTGCTRAWNGSTAVAHGSGEKVYSPDATVLNAALGFNIASTGASAGEINVTTAAQGFFFTTLPKLIMWDLSFLRLSEWLQYLRWILTAISLGFIIFVVHEIAAFLGGILQGIFNRP